MLSTTCIMCIRLGSSKARGPTFKQAANAMAKLLQANVPKKKKPGKSVASRGSTEKAAETLFPRGAPTKGNIRRRLLLDSMFFEKVTDLFSTGEIGADLHETNFQISKVKITNDLQILNVFWVPNGDESDVKTAKILDKNAGLLRKKLTELGLMGRIPHVIFSQDRSTQKLQEVFKSIHLAKDSMVLPELDNEYKEKEIQMEDEDLPAVRTDIYGLRHEDIMTKIVLAMKKSRQRVEKASRLPQPLVLPLRNEVNDKVDSSALIRTFLKRQEAKKEARTRKDRKADEEAEDFYVEEARLRAKEHIEGQIERFYPEEYDTTEEYFK